VGEVLNQPYILDVNLHIVRRGRIHTNQDGKVQVVNTFPKNLFYGILCSKDVQAVKESKNKGAQHVI
jgi:hypothetical protein